MYHHILVPISFDQDRDAAGALGVARALAAEDARITLLHVMERIPAYAISYLPEDYVEESRRAIESELKTLADDLPRGQAHVIEGHPGRSILDWAEGNGVDCIVLASHRPGMQDLLLGSTTSHLVRHASCAVHVLR